MYNRLLKQPKKSFFLLGPRGTGKTTWLNLLRFDLKLNLLHSKLRLDLERNPSHLQELVAPLKKGSWVLIDEVQKIPALLDEVQLIYDNFSINFALSGSSARKLKRSGVNLLAGRAINYKIFPLCYDEYKEDLPLEQRIEWGTVPLLVSNFSSKEDTLETYVDNYLRQELTEEGIVRKLEPFSRFLQVAGIMNGQVLNVEAIARECKISRSTVDKYFEVLYDTLIAYKLPGYQPGLKVKELASPKFYFFDSGVARAVAGLTREHLDKSYTGFLFETFLLNEIRAYNFYSGQNRDLFHYSISNSYDIDLIIQLQKRTISRTDKIIACEFKLSKNWDSRWSRNLEDFKQNQKVMKVERLIGVYSGDRKFKSGEVEVFPVDLFLKELFAQKIY
ncbi:MAG: ATP-binding protein [Oligoflexia bacterium]|nr:ATP-binding protein [Oligoflexia bacterium]MBF0366892.1 ATP-binding protein [Oligoflexia bacterium]